MYLCPQDLLDSMYPFFHVQGKNAYYILIYQPLQDCRFGLLHTRMHSSVHTYCTYTGAEQAVVVFRSHNGCAPERSRPSHNPFFVSLDAEP